MSDIQTNYHYDDAADSLTIDRVQDMSPIITQIQNEKLSFNGYKNETFNKVGTIPAMIVEAYMKEVGITYQEFMVDQTHIKRIMNNPDYSKFKIITGDV